MVAPSSLSFQLIILSTALTTLGLIFTFVATASHFRVLSSLPRPTVLYSAIIYVETSTHSAPNGNVKDNETVTLRQFLMHPDGYHLAMAPAFFGFYAYFGALAALNEDVAPTTDNVGIVLPKSGFEEGNKTLLKSVAGASAGAMAAVLLSAGISPRRAAEFASSLGLPQFADPPGFGGVLKGDLFESLMKDFLESEVKARLKMEKGMESEDGEEHYIGELLRLENSVIPVAVTGFDLLRMKGKVLKSGCMARAARASATFPGLFQPVGWWEAGNNSRTKDGTISTLRTSTFIPPFLLIDGGIGDMYGIVGLSSLIPHESNKRIVNLVTGSFGVSGPPGPSDMPPGIHAKEVVSISILNTPDCGPWNMENGPRAVTAAQRAIQASLDTPMSRGAEAGHYELHIDASGFIPN
mmetsp:Transcript_3715/g.5036  ORF Transcript_3715/g.5036 Transcript_3715/m.5036 type:complete len:410 (+) Transcript_3715:135-1364(+)